MLLNMTAMSMPTSDQCPKEKPCFLSPCDIIVPFFIHLRAKYNFFRNAIVDLLSNSIIKVLRDLHCTAKNP